MIMAPRLRKFVLTAHITSSVSWMGGLSGAYFCVSLLANCL